MKKRYGALDLGSNTFHLLIMDIDTETGEWTYITNEFFYVRLAEFSEGSFSVHVINTAHKALRKIKKCIDKYRPLEVYSVGTAALRTTENGHKIIDYAAENLDLNIHIVSGKKEAEFVLSGVKKSLQNELDSFINIDIGGGSVEVSILQHSEHEFSDSFPIGVGLLYKKFHKNDPLEKEELDQSMNFLDKQLHEFITRARKMEIKAIVGSSGTFDVLADICGREKNASYHKLDSEKVRDSIESLIFSSLEERKNDIRIPTHRKLYIPVGFAIVKYFMKQLHSVELYSSDYAIKEGIINQLATSSLHGQSFA